LQLIKSAAYLRAQMTIIITRTITISSSNTIQAMIPANAPASNKQNIFYTITVDKQHHQRVR